jgi:hypothetical protein
MKMRWLPAAVLVMALANQEVVRGDDWKSDIAKKTIGRAARAGIENAMREAVQDAAFDVAREAVMPDPDLQTLRELGDDERWAAVGSTAIAGIEAGMTVADVASDIEQALDVAEAAKNINKARKAIKRIKR